MGIPAVLGGSATSGRPQIDGDYMATHPASFFTHNILASAVTPEGRVNIMNQGVHIIRNGAAEPAHLADRKALRTLIAQHFGFDLPELMKVDAVPDWQ